MPRRASTSSTPSQPAAAVSSRENVQYIVKGSDPVYATICVVTFVLLMTAVVLEYLELTTLYNYGWAIFFAAR